MSKAIKQDCETILAEAMPALNAAIAALDTIKTADIRLVQTFKNPPQAVKVVMEAVCVMLDVKPTMVADPNIPGGWVGGETNDGEPNFNQGRGGDPG